MLGRLAEELHRQFADHLSRVLRLLADFLRRNREGYAVALGVYQQLLHETLETAQMKAQLEQILSFSQESVRRSKERQRQWDISFEALLADCEEWEVDQSKVGGASDSEEDDESERDSEEEEEEEGDRGGAGLSDEPERKGDCRDGGDADVKGASTSVPDEPERKGVCRNGVDADMKGVSTSMPDEPERMVGDDA